ncbi:MAG: hypothetical protein P1U41_03395 [Vicingaceae bacterium]|nr:hypothetical protein [Vicingaceae bacterium]
MRLHLYFIVFLTFIFFNPYGFSQSPDLINYQAVARDLSGNPLVSTAVNITYDIRQNSSIGTIVYSETHNLTTNQFGLFTAEIGGGTPVTGTFAGINWSTGLYYLQVTVNGDVMAATQLLSVPYALHANTATSGSPGANGHANLADSVAEPAGVNCANGGYLIHMGADDNDNNTLEPLERDISYYICNGLDGTANNNDTSATNELQTLAINGDTLFISGGNYVLIPNTGSLWQSNSPDIYFSTGKVGIGTSTPNRTLAIETSSLTGDGISINNSSSGNPGIEFQTLGNPRYVMGIDQSDNNKFKIGTTNIFTNTRLTINSLGNVGIGTNNPFHRFSVASTDSVIASFVGANPNASIVSIASINPNAVTGEVFLTGSDSAIIAIDPALKTFFLSNTTTDGHIAVTADSSVGTYAPFIHQQGLSLYNQVDSIFHFSSGPNGVFHVNQGLFVTDSLYVVGANPGNAGWLLADDGFGQAVWTDPISLGLGGGLWTQGTGDIFNTTDSVGIGVANPSALLHVSGGGLGKPTALFEAGGFTNATININHTGSNGSGIIFQNGGAFTSGISSSTSNVLTLTSDFVEVGNSPKTGIFNVAGNSSVTKPTILLHEPTTGFSRIKHTNGVANKYWIVEAGISASNPQSGYSIGYNNGVSTSLPFIVYGDNKVGVNNLATPLASFHVMDINTTGNGMVTEGFSQPGLLVVGRNNFASPNRGAVLNGDQIGKIVFPGYAGVSYGDGPQIIANATENYSSSANGSEMVFRTIPNGTNSDQDVLTLLNDGTVEVPINLRVLNGAGNAGDVLTSDAAGNASWQTPSGGGASWLIAGNSGTNPSNDFIGTTDNTPLHFRVNNITAGRIDHILFNTSLGRSTLQSVTTGQHNTAIGNNAMIGNTTGFHNTAIGSQALQGGNSNANVAIGWRALMSSSGGDNTALGYQAGNTITTGSSNTFLGYDADAASNNLTNATAIGANAIVGQSNSLILGNNANVGIGTSSPVSSLNIIYSGTNTEAGLINYTQSNATLNGTGFYSAANTNGTGEITAGAFRVSLSGNSSKSVAVSAANSATSSLNIGLFARVSGTNISATHIGGVFEVVGGASNHALQLIDGSEGNGKILTSDATGKTTWQPNAVAFETFMSNPQGVINTTFGNTGAIILRFDGEIIDEGGNNFDPNPGVNNFKAPHNGVYSIQASVIFENIGATPNTEIQLGLMKNGGFTPLKVSTIVMETSNANVRKTGTINATIRLAAGDILHLEAITPTAGATINMLPSEASWFSGHLVYAN